MISDRDFRRRMLETVAALTGVVLLIATLWAAREALMLVYVSALIAIGFAPIVSIIERPGPNVRRRTPRWLAILAIYMAIVAVLVAISSLIGGIFGLITILILTFYLLIEAQTMFDYFLRFVPPARRGDVTVAAREAVSKVSAWLRAQFVLAGVMGTFAAVGLWLMDVPYFYVIALIAAIGETIPIVGPVIGGITAVAVAISVSPKLALMVGIYFLVLHQLEANVLVPKIMERRVGVSPVAVMVALLVGGAVWGLVGAILAIPTAAILSVIIEEVAAEHEVRIQRIR